MTEASPVALIVPYDLASDETLASSGLLVPSVTARLMDEENNDVKEGEAGELWVRGPNVMKVCRLDSDSHMQNAHSYPRDTSTTPPPQQTL